MTLPKSNVVRDAVLHIKQQRKGTSLAQIRKHLDGNSNQKMDTARKRILLSTLKGLVQTGQLQKKGLVYKLAERAKTEGAEVPARRRPHGYCKTHHLYHHKKGWRSGRRRRRSRRRRRRSRRHHRRGRRPPHKHCKRSYRYKRGHRAPNRRGHRHCPRR